MKEYLEASLTNTFSELIYRLTQERYTEEKAIKLWEGISTHRKKLEKLLNRDVGLLVATLDYLTNITEDMLNPKVMDDLRIEEAATMATKDFLTGLYLHWVLYFSLERSIQEHYRKNKNISLIMMDIDEFKKINDQNGHQAGDKILKKIGEIIFNSIRKADLPVRYGGDEFAIILPETSIEQADVVINKLLRNVKHAFDEKKYCSPITVSIGVSSFNVSNRVTAKELVFQSDNALSQAKNKGKNRVEKYY
ncbi:MAG: GGDEF domain-containing protein [Victivallales bacterium]|nr:GGDEF domain-containing protein [Victivallales bacterium]